MQRKRSSLFSCISQDLFESKLLQYKDDHIVYRLNKVRKIKTMNDLYHEP